jgi:tetratricopeptide (TPR) repeat protein
MLSLVVSALIALVFGFVIGFFVNVGFGIFIGSIILVSVFFFMTRHFSRKLQTIFNFANSQLQKQQIEQAIETLKDGYEIGKWAFLGKAQVDSQIGVILYTQKKFGEAYKYLQKSNPRIFQAYCMLIVGHIKNKKIKEAKEAITLLIKLNKKEPFVYSFAGYIYANELKEKAMALTVLENGLKVLPDDVHIKEQLLNMKNNKPYKMSKWGDIWAQLMLEKNAINKLQQKYIKSQQKRMKIKRQR